MSKEQEMIQQFIEQMRQHHSAEINAIDLPEGTRDYVVSRMQDGDEETLIFMLKLAYLMGLPTGVAASEIGERGDIAQVNKGPLQA